MSAFTSVPQADSEPKTVNSPLKDVSVPKQSANGSSEEKRSEELDANTQTHGAEPHNDPAPAAVVRVKKSEGQAAVKGKGTRSDEEAKLTANSAKSQQERLEEGTLERETETGIKMSSEAGEISSVAIKQKASGNAQDLIKQSTENEKEERNVHFQEDLCRKPTQGIGKKTEQGTRDEPRIKVLHTSKQPEGTPENEYNSPYHMKDGYFDENSSEEADSELGYDFGSSVLDDNYGFFSGATRRINTQYNNWMWYLRSRRTGGHQEFKSGRLLDRDNAFHQSTGLMHVSHSAKGETRSQVLDLYTDDWFHVLLSLETYKILILLGILVTLVYLLFAGLFIWVDRSSESCNLASEGRNLTFQGAFAFSLITSSTVGYGFPGSGDPFFYDCPGLLAVVYFQVVVSLMVNAFVVGLILQRVGRADTRCHQVVFSDKACIRCIGGHFYFTLQVYDLDRRHPVVEAHVRCYAVFHETDGKNTALFQTRYMRLQNPNDELGGVLFLSVPCTVVHQIDQWSPLLPPKESRIWEKYNDNFVHNSSNRYVFPGLILREADAECGERSGASCPVCGESFNTEMHLMRHIRYMRNQEELEEKLANASKTSEKKETEKKETRKTAPSVTSPRASANETKKSAIPQRLRSFNTHGSEVKSASMNDLESENAKLRNRSSSITSQNSRNRKDSDTNSAKIRLRKSKSSKLRRREYRTQNSTEGAVFLPRSSNSVDKNLVQYADLTKQITHRDVDFSLLQTDIHLVSAKDKKSTLEELFSPLDQSVNSVATKNNMYLKLKTRRVEDLRDAIRDHVTSSKLEIVVLVEGIEARSSNTFQARHSYTHENIVFDKFFATCMEVAPDGHAQVNLNHFHTVVPGKVLPTIMRN